MSEAPSSGKLGWALLGIALYGVAVHPVFLKFSYLFIIVLVMLMPLSIFAEWVRKPFKAGVRVVKVRDVTCVKLVRNQNCFASVPGPEPIEEKGMQYTHPSIL